MVTLTRNPVIVESSFATQTRSDHDFAVDTVIGQMRADVSYPFTLDIFAEMANYSPFHFARLFRQSIGVPPGEFLAALRFERAKHLILRTDASITDICFDVGFSSLGTFSARFKQLVGIGPAELRAMPEQLAPRLPDLGPCMRSAPSAPSGTGFIVTGNVTSPRPCTGHLFIGLFPTAIPQSAPVAGTLAAGPGPFTIHNVPPGTWRLLAALFPPGNDPLTHLLPGDSLRVGADPWPVVVSPDVDPRPLHVELRHPLPTDPPILSALAPKVLNI
ncbi:MAG: helix-turn-helix transcriptional regulator [Chloroflexota bacterium]|nr:helix-turn-helix transcriptional regulator [Chloroflexota bacterium]